MRTTVTIFEFLIVFIIFRSNDVTSFGLNCGRKRILTATSIFSTNTDNEVQGEGNFYADNDIDTIVLKQQNELLEKKVLQLERDNQNLQETCSCYQVVIENFEGEGREDSWYKPKPVETENEWSVEPSASLQEVGADTCPLEPSISFIDALRDRAYWLVGLLAFQSCSGFILSQNEALLETHPFIVFFLTMLVGAGGNAGNQASVRVIRGLALGSLNESTQGQFLLRELKMAFVLSVILSVAGFTRAIVFSTPLPETIAITCALALIVFSSICLGAVLPLVLKKVGIDPAHSSTTIQVVMDILGVVFTVFVSRTLLDNPLIQTYIYNIASNSV